MNCEFCGKEIQEDKTIGLQFEGRKNNYLSFFICLDCMEELLGYFRKREEFNQFKAGQKQ